MAKKPEFHFNQKLEHFKYCFKLEKCHDVFHKIIKLRNILTNSCSIWFLSIKSAYRKLLYSISFSSNKKCIYSLVNLVYNLQLIATQGFLSAN
jgi:hypothetical protein